MSEHDFFILSTCLIVFAVLVVLSTIIVTTIVKQNIKLIKYGEYDETTKEEFNKNKTKKTNKALDLTLTIVVSALLIGFCGFSFFMNTRTSAFSDTIPTLRVVESDSMSEKHENNTYLVENNLNDQFNTYALILTYKKPKEEELKLYDVVVYKINNDFVVHRIVEIEEANEEHPQGRWFRTQGDAVNMYDRNPVTYEQIVAIYRGQQIPFVGSIIMFAKSPAGILCVALILITTIVSPFIEKRIQKEKKDRYAAISVNSVKEDKQA